MERVLHWDMFRSLARDLSLVQIKRRSLLLIFYTFQCALCVYSRQAPLSTSVSLEQSHFRALHPIHSLALSFKPG